MSYQKVQKPTTIKTKRNLYQVTKCLDQHMLIKGSMGLQPQHCNASRGKHSTCSKQACCKKWRPLITLHTENVFMLPWKLSLHWPWPHPTDCRFLGHSDLASIHGMFYRSQSNKNQKDNSQKGIQTQCSLSTTNQPVSSHRLHRLSSGSSNKLIKLPMSPHRQTQDWTKTGKRTQKENSKICASMSHKDPLKNRS